MYEIRQEELFSFQQLMNLKSEDKYTHIFENLDLGPILQVLGKASRLGRPEKLNYRAMIYSLLISKMERIEFVKDIIRKLKNSEEFRLLCRFTGSDRTPSEASYSRLISTLHRSEVLEKTQDELVRKAIGETFVSGKHVAVDASAVDAWDCQHDDQAAKRRATRRKKSGKVLQVEQLQVETDITSDLEVEVAPEPKAKRGKGRPSKAESEQIRKEREEREANLPIFEKKVADMLAYSHDELQKAMPRDPAFCAKKNSKGNLTSWYGFKANVLVDTDSQYILNGLFCSANLSDQRLAVVLLKGLKEKFPTFQIGHVMGDKGYDSTPIYQLIREIGAYPIIAFIHHTKPPEGTDEHFRPVCAQGHAYQYDSFDKQYKTLKYISPKACKECPLAENGCQKVYKIQLEQNIRQYTYPARGSISYKKLYNKRTAVERVFAYLKEYFGMHRTRHRGTRAFVDFQLSTLAYNLSKFALDKLNQALRHVPKAS